MYDHFWYSALPMSLISYNQFLIMVNVPQRPGHFCPPLGRQWRPSLENPSPPGSGEPGNEHESCTLVGITMSYYHIKSKNVIFIINNVVFNAFYTHNGNAKILFTDSSHKPKIFLYFCIKSRKHMSTLFVVLPHEHLGS